jgi:S-adenosylmethionine synthetase
MLKYLAVRQDYIDPAVGHLEVVENKGIGHPDSLADAVANVMSVAYSRWCLEHFGAILHHNFDKVFVGGGWYRNGYGTAERRHPIVVRSNGRVSDRLGGQTVPYKEIMAEAARDYLLGVLPHATADDLDIIIDATQNTKVPYWFTPRTLADVPDSKKPHANDTSLCVGHWGDTPVEALVRILSGYFWEAHNGLAIPQFAEIGQDIKVLAVRRGHDVEVEVCVPTMSRATASRDDYLAIIGSHQNVLSQIGAEFGDEHQLCVTVGVNTHQHQYMLGVGTCAECGEEGLVGRGNSINGLISSHRTHTAEAWAGKNPRYFTGSVMSYLSHRLARAIGTSFSTRCSVAISTRCGDSLIPPRMVQVSLPAGGQIDLAAISEQFRENVLELDYLHEILAFRPWVEQP